MLALGVDFLSGRYAATVYNDRDRAEWPPHPARFFSALVATWAEGEPASREGEAELQALRWLERQAAPDIVASSNAAVAVRDVVRVFVPVNDVAAEQRLRQPRTFPSVTPAVPRVVFVWPTAKPTAEQQTALGRLLARLVRLGHSSSLVDARIVDDASVAASEAQSTRFVSDQDNGSLILRWVAAGQVDRLIAAFDRHRETEPRVLPSTFVRYREGLIATSADKQSSVFGDDWVVLARVDGPRLPSTATAGVAKQLRRALMSFADQPVPELLSGHRPDGAASHSPHLAVVPLPFIGSKHADGAILGVALVLPRSTASNERGHVLSAIARFEAANSANGDEDAPSLPLHLGSAGVLRLQRVVWGEHTNVGLRPGTWSRSACRWATATPVALDRNPGDLHDPDPAKRRAAFEAATADIMESVRRIGLPAPVQVDVLRSCVLPGSAKPHTFPRFPGDSARPQRVLVHVRLVFAAPVEGPILLGAGRYHGLGLFRPVDDNREVLS